MIDVSIPASTKGGANDHSAANDEAVGGSDDVNPNDHQGGDRNGDNRGEAIERSYKRRKSPLPRLLVSAAVVGSGKKHGRQTASTRCDGKDRVSNSNSKNGSYWPQSLASSQARRSSSRLQRLRGRSGERMGSDGCGDPSQQQKQKQPPSSQQQQQFEKAPQQGLQHAAPWVKVKKEIRRRSRDGADAIWRSLSHNSKDELDESDNGKFRDAKINQIEWWTAHHQKPRERTTAHRRRTSSTYTDTSDNSHSKVASNRRESMPSVNSRRTLPKSIDDDQLQSSNHSLPTALHAKQEQKQLRRQYSKSLHVDQLHTNNFSIPPAQQQQQQQRRRSKAPLLNSVPRDSNTMVDTSESIGVGSEGGGKMPIRMSNALYNELIMREMEASPRSVAPTNNDSNHTSPLILINSHSNRNMDSRDCGRGGFARRMSGLAEDLLLQREVSQRSLRNDSGHGSRDRSSGDSLMDYFPDLPLGDGCEEGLDISIHNGRFMRRSLHRVDEKHSVQSSSFDSSMSRSRRSSRNDAPRSLPMLAAISGNGKLDQDSSRRSSGNNDEQRPPPPMDDRTASSFGGKQSSARPENSSQRPPDPISRSGNSQQAPDSSGRPGVSGDPTKSKPERSSNGRGGCEVTTARPSPGPKSRSSSSMLSVGDGTKVRPRRRGSTRLSSSLLSHQYEEEQNRRRSGQARSRSADRCHEDGLVRSLPWDSFKHDDLMGAITSKKMNNDGEDVEDDGYADVCEFEGDTRRGTHGSSDDDMLRVFDEMLDRDDSDALRKISASRKCARSSDDMLELLSEDEKRTRQNMAGTDSARRKRKSNDDLLDMLNDDNFTNLLMWREDDNDVNQRSKERDSLASAPDRNNASSANRMEDGNKTKGSTSAETAIANKAVAESRGAKCSNRPGANEENSAENDESMAVPKSSSSGFQVRVTPITLCILCICYCISLLVVCTLVSFGMYFSFYTNEDTLAQAAEYLGNNSLKPQPSSLGSWHDGTLPLDPSYSTLEYPSHFPLATTKPSMMPPTTSLMSSSSFPTSQPSSSSSSSPSSSRFPSSMPSNMPSVSPTSIPECPEQLLKSVALDDYDDLLTLNYEVVVYQGDMANGVGGLLCMSLEYAGSAGWIGLAFSEATRDPQFGRKEAIIGMPGMRSSRVFLTEGSASSVGQHNAALGEMGLAFTNPGKYEIPPGGIEDGFYGPSLSLLRGIGGQTLINGSVSMVWPYSNDAGDADDDIVMQMDPRTRMSFVKYLREPNEISIDPYQPTLLLYAAAAPLRNEDGTINGYNGNPEWKYTYLNLLNSSDVRKRKRQLELNK